MRYFVKISYDGASYSGWQVQPNAPTVQECLEHSLSTLLKARVPAVGAGRTDSQVNAVGYVAHFDFEGPVPENLAGSDGKLDAMKFGCKLNAILPSGIVVHEVREVDGDLHARFSATRREYTYFIHRTKDPFVEDHSYFFPQALDVEAMNLAAGSLVGTHDFRCFEKLGSDNKTSVCTVTEAEWRFYEPSHVAVMGFQPSCTASADDNLPAGGCYLFFRISADRFLRNMVRAVVGSLLEVGRGKRSVEDFVALVLPVPGSSSTPVSGPATASVSISAAAPVSGYATAHGVEAGRSHVAADGTPFRSKAGESVPGHALFLSSVKY